MLRRTDDRVRALSDPQSERTDPLYRMTMTMWRSWLAATRMSLEDERIDDVTIGRVLDRLVLGTPFGADVVERERLVQMTVDILERSSRPLIVEHVHGHGAAGDGLPRG